MNGTNPASPSLLDFQSLKFRFSRRLLPFTPPDIFMLDTLETQLPATEVSQIVIAKLSHPIISSNLCVAQPSLQNLVYPFKKSAIADLTSWLKEALSYPKIELLFNPICAPHLKGKVYPKKGGEEAKETTQSSLFPEMKCRHGLAEGTCATCITEKEQKKKQIKLLFDIFDFIFPILLPPLKLENISEFLPGKDLYPFQPKGIKFLASKEAALLGDEMGLGKTVQAVIAMSILFHSGKVTNALVVCPRSVFTTWGDHFENWAPALRVLNVRGNKLLRQMKWSSPSHVYLTTYETLREDLANIPDKDFSICVIDEAQKIKNPTALVTKTVRQINAKIRWGLSGTPLENRVEELISIFAYLKPGLLRYEDAHWPRLVTEKIKPFFLRRRKTDVLKDLPEKRQSIDWLDLTPAQQAAYDKAENEGIVALNKQGETVTVQHILALITKLKQICNFEVVSGESSKLEYLIDKLEAIQEQGDKALVFSQFPEKTLKFLEPKLKKFDPFIYHGGLSDHKRDSIIKKFQNEDESKLLLMSLKAGGLGLNLQRANYVYHFDQWWNPATSMQAEDRVHRIGQEKTVFVTTLMTKGTIEEKIQKVLERKRLLFKEVIDNLSEVSLTEALSKEELFSLFNLKVVPQKGKGKLTSSKKITIDDIYKLSPEEFEKLVARLYESMGYYVKLTPISRDEGVDLYAKKVSDSGTVYLIIQCKHYPNRKVGVEHVRSLYGVLTSKQAITKGILITSGQFSEDAKNFAQDNRIELYDCAYLFGLLHKYDVSLV